MRYTSHSPLPVFMPYGRYKGERISSLSTPYLRKAIDLPHLDHRLRAAMRAEMGLRVMACDQYFSRN